MDSATNTTTSERPVGVLLMTFGSAATAEEVPAYMASVRGGRAAAPELVAEFQRRYQVVGGSPLVRITKEQAAALERLLNGQGTAAGPSFLVRSGMQHSRPTIAEAMAELGAAKVQRLVAIVLSPQYSPLIMGGYNRAVEAARDRLPADANVTVAGSWHREPEFIAAQAQLLAEALERVPPSERASVPVIFTAHSLPERVVKQEPDYLEQIQETVRAVAAWSGLAPERWQFAYQSAGHSPEPWLTPDLKDLLPGLRAAGHHAVLVVPVQFLADHLEILYDLDVAAREESEAAGLRFVRIEMPNTMPRFIHALANVVQRTLAGGDA